jgi:ammonium transporter, Amt family
MESDIKALTVLFTEFYYFVTIALMFLIHAGFCLYEVGLSRQKNQFGTILKNTMVIPVVTITFYLFGWWLYFAVANGPWINGGLIAAPFATPWSELMGPHMGGKPASSALTAADTATWARVNGVFWGAFLLFSCTSASIISGAAIERIKSGGFWIIAAFVGSVTWIIAAAWGWSAPGWMVQKLGFHDAYAAGVVHAVAGASALAVVILLGPRIGKFGRDGKPRNIPPSNVWMTTVGLFLIFTGFWGFYVACNIPVMDIDPDEKRTFFSATTIYLTPVTLSAITFNFLMAFAGGLLMGYTVSKGDVYWTYSGGLAGIIGTSAGNDLYHPIQALFIAAAVVWVVYRLHYWVERRFKLDDAVGAVAVHGYAGFLSVVIAGFVLWGYPATADAHGAIITPWGNAIGAVICFVGLGFIPVFALAAVLKKCNLLRADREVEIAGLDYFDHQTARAEVKAARDADSEAARELAISV